MTNMSLALIAVYFEHAPSASDNPSADFGVGPFGSSYYTKAECDITRNKPYNFSFFEAYPDVNSNMSVLADLLESQFSSSVASPTANNGWNVSMPSGEDMIRLYQAYCTPSATTRASHTE